MNSSSTRPGAALVVALLAACSSSANLDPLPPRNVVATVSPSTSTVVTVSWTTDRPAIGYVEYGPTEKLGYKTAVEKTESLTHSMNLLGLTANTQYFFRVLTWGSQDAGASAKTPVLTGALPAGLPPFTVQGAGNDQYTFVALRGSPNIVTILDPQANVVWAYTDTSGLDITRVRRAADGQSVLYNTVGPGGEPVANAALVRVSMAGAPLGSFPLPMMGSDFVETTPGAFAALVAEYRDFQGQQIRGDKIVAIDAAGVVTDVWSTWDCFDPAVVPGDDIATAWTAASALNYEPGAYYVALRNHNSIVKINPTTRQCDWVLGGTASTFTFAAGSNTFVHPHQFHFAGTKIVVMDNDGSGATQSRMLAYTLDTASSTATEALAFASAPPLYTQSLGAAQQLTQGATFINWGDAGVLERVTPEGATQWKATAAGARFSYHTLGLSL